MIVKGTTKSGIQYQLDSRIKNDARLLFLLTKAQNAEDPMVAGKTIMDLLSLIFGSEDNVLVFMNEVAAKHKGVCQTKDLIIEISDMFEGLNAKNS
jgi:hypothetical protein